MHARQILNLWATSQSPKKSFKVEGGSPQTGGVGNTVPYRCDLWPCAWQLADYWQLCCVRSKSVMEGTKKRGHLAVVIGGLYVQQCDLTKEVHCRVLHMEGALENAEGWSNGSEREGRALPWVMTPVLLVPPFCEPQFCLQEPEIVGLTDSCGPTSSKNMWNYVKIYVII
jgi:hypothetical protein